MSLDKNTLLADKYKFISKIASGSYGEVYLTNGANNKDYAAKIEEKKATSRLRQEYEIYKTIKKAGVTNGIPRIMTFIETPQYNVMVMELLGKSLDNLLSDHGGIFDMGTVLKLGIEIVTLLQNVHKAGIIHRDIKPNNFLVGSGDKKDTLYIMDFGLSKQFRIADNQHIGIRIERSLVGTARYVSTNVHMGIEPSRRDDLESTGYMLVYFLKGRLPWQGLKKKKETDDQIKLIGDTKMMTNIKKLCEYLPKCFVEYLQYCRKLNFDEEPDYEYLKSLFIEESNTNSIALEYCWLQNM